MNRVAERAGFEPAVVLGSDTLPPVDFESTALDQARPPLRYSRSYPISRPMTVYEAIVMQAMLESTDDLMMGLSCRCGCGGRPCTDHYIPCFGASQITGPLPDFSGDESRYWDDEDDA